METKSRSDVTSPFGMLTMWLTNFVRRLDTALLPFYNYPVAGRSRTQQLAVLVRKAAKGGKNIKFLLPIVKNVVLSVLAVVYLPLSPIMWLTRYRIIMADLSQIGTICYLDLHVRKLLVNQSRTEYICLIAKSYRTNNSYLIRLYSRYYRFVDGYWARVLLLPFTLHPWLTQDTHKYNSPSRFNLTQQDEHPCRIFAKSLEITGNVPLVSMPVEDVVTAEAVLRSLNIDIDRMITLHVRDASFYGEGSVSARNATVLNYEYAVESAINRGYTVVRVGRSHNIPLDEWRQKFGCKFFDYCKSHLHSDVLDVYFCVNSIAHIGTISGLSYVYDLVFIKPTLYTNAATAAETLGFNELDVTLFKKIKSIDTGKFIELKRYFEMPLDEPISISQLKEIGLTIEENTADELKDTFEEFIFQVEQGYVQPPSDLQRECVGYLQDNHGSYHALGKYSEKFLASNICRSTDSPFVKLTIE